MRNYFGIREGEFEPAVLLGLQLMLGIGSVICLKSAADALFLSRFEAERLPLVDLTITGLVGVAVGFYIRLSNRFPLGRLIGFSQIFLALNLFLFWLLMRWDVVGIPALIYVWVGIFAVLVPSQVWSLAGLVFDTRQAKRLFSLIGSGGIVGAALGGRFASVLGSMFGPQNLLLATLGFLLLCAALVFRLTSCTASRERVMQKGATGTKASIRESFRLVRSRRYLRLMAGVLLLSTVVSTLIKYQFKATAKAHYLGDETELIAFFGDFNGYIAVISFLFHVLLSGRLLRWVGLGMTLLILPLSVGVGAAALLFSGSLGAAIFARGTDLGFRHSVDRASIELLYVPISTAVRAQVKSFLDMVVSRSADGLASGILLLMLTGLHFELGQISWVSLGVIAVWLGFLWQLRGEYVHTLRSSIERKDVSPEELLRSVAQSAPGSQLDTTLQSSDLRAVETAVDWMQYGGATAERAQLASLLTHESGVIRRKTMAVVATNGLEGYGREVLKFLELEPEVEARWQGLEYLENEDPVEAAKAVEGFLDSDDRNLAATAAAWMLHHEERDLEKAEQTFRAYIEWAASEAASHDPTTRATAVRLIGFAPSVEGLRGALSKFLRDDDIEVVRAALLSAATAKPTDEVPTILAALHNRRLRRDARDALAAFGEPILEELNDSLRKPSLEVGARLALPRVMSAVGGPKAARLLLAHLNQPDRDLRYQVLRALIRIRENQPAVRFDREKTSELVVEELRYYYSENLLLNGIPSNGLGPGARFLQRALQERLKQRVDSIFRLLALVYPQREISDAYHWTLSGRPELRSNALEFLDSRLDNPVRQMLLPVLEDSGSQRLLETARDLFGLEPVAYPDLLRPLLETPDPWLQACTCYVVSENGSADLLPRVERLARSSDPLVAETASLAYTKLSRQGEEPH